MIPAPDNLPTRERKPCVICGGPATVEQIDSSIGVLVTVYCSDCDCNAHWNNGWYQELEDAELAWYHRQIGEAALNDVLPFPPPVTPSENSTGGGET